MTKPYLALSHGVILSLLASLFFLGCLTLRFHGGTPPVTVILPSDRDRKQSKSEHAAFITLASHKGKNGWLLNPVTAAVEARLPGGAKSCKSVHVGEIKPGGVRGNHRHRSCNETFVIWGAKTLFRFEDGGSEKHYGEVWVGAEDVLVATSPQGRAHALANFDHSRTTYFVGCQDVVINSSNPNTDYQIWKDL